MLVFIQLLLLLAHVNQNAADINVSQLKLAPLTLSDDYFKNLLNCNPEPQDELKLLPGFTWDSGRSLSPTFVCQDCE